MVPALKFNYHNKTLTDILFAASVVVFILLKLPHLPLPFFWDEMGVYGNMVFQLSDNRLSLHPKVLNEWMTRGHPLLYPNTIAAVCKVFGETVTVAHATNLGIMCALLISMYLFLKKHFSPWVGFIAGVLLFSQPILFTQSILVLPEVALTFFLWFSTVFFIKRNYLAYFIAGSCAVLVKEPAIIWIGGLFLYDYIRITKNGFLKTHVWLTPLIPFGIFLMVQKQALGWFLFPYHAGGFDLKMSNIMQQLGDYGHYIFIHESRFLWLGIILFAIMLLIRKPAIAPADTHGIFPRAYASLLAAGIYIVFSSTTFYSPRYILPVFPVLCSAVAILLYYGISRQNPLIALPLTLIVTIISFQFMTSKQFDYDSNMSYIPTLDSYKKTLTYLIDNDMYGDGEISANLPFSYAMNDKRYGYLPEGNYQRFPGPVIAETKYVINVTPGTSIENPDNFPLEQMATLDHGDIQVKIYKVLPTDTIQNQTE